jgi:hypothetical protein
MLEKQPDIRLCFVRAAIGSIEHQQRVGAVLRQRYEPIEQKLGRDFTEFFLGTIRSALTVRSRFTSGGTVAEQPRW